MSVVILIPAAGASARMQGRDKLLEEIDTVPLLRRTALRAGKTGAPVIVVLPRDRPGRLASLGGLDLTIPDPIDATEGMAASIRAGIAALPDNATGVMILLADLPDLTAQDLSLLIGRFETAPDRIHRATAADGTPGHPVIFPARCFADLARVTGDDGARSVLTGEAIRHVALPGRHAVTDLDTPEAWAAWRAQRR